MSNELTKLIIRGYEKDEELSQQRKPVAEFRVMFNPENFNIGNVFKFDDAQSDSETGSEQKFKSVGAREFSYQFLIDGTNASGTPVDVVEQIDLFRKTTGFAGKERRPLYLSISFGTFTIRCIVKAFEFNYTLFSNDGKPVRATINATFCEYKTPLLQLLENPDLANKLTRLVSMDVSQTLDLLAHTIYGDSDKLIEIAKANGLNSLKSIADGLQLELPSIDELKEQANAKVEQASNAIQQGISNLF